MAAQSAGDPARAAHRPPQQIRLVALDIDGTLLRTDKRLSIRAVRAIREARDRGVHVVLASARPPRSVREIYSTLGLRTLQINYNGAVIFDPQRNRIAHHCPIDAELAQQVARLARKMDPQVAISVEILDRWYTDRVQPELATETSKAFEPDFVGPLADFLNQPVTKLMLLAPAERLEPIRDHLEEHFAGQIGLAVSDAHLIQIVHPDVDKASALQRIAADYNIAREQVMAIGDAPNDAGMLRWAGLGAAVENAWLEALESADIVIPSNDNDGVALAFEQYVLT